MPGKLNSMVSKSGSEVEPTIYGFAGCYAGWLHRLGTRPSLPTLSSPRRRLSRWRGEDQSKMAISARKGRALPHSGAAKPECPLHWSTDKLSSLVVLCFLLLSSRSGAASPAERLFVLRDQNHILQYKMDGAGAVSLVKTYSDRDFPQAFPADRIEMQSGNLLSTYDENGKLKARLLYNPATDVLKAYDGNAGAVNSPEGRILEKPSLDESFRGERSVYFGTSSGYRQGLQLDEFRSRAGSKCRDVFALEGQIFCVSEDHIDRLTRQGGASLLSAPERALDLLGTTLVAASESPWKEVFISDSAKPSLQRVIWRDGALRSNGSVTGNGLSTPGALAFAPDGELFVAQSGSGSSGVLRYRFASNNPAQSPAEAGQAIDLGGSGALSVALARPVGFVFSHKNQHLEPPSLEEARANGVHGIIETGLIGSESNSETAVIGLVEYAPAGYHAVHLHSQKEQVVVILEGRSLWEVGEIEKEVGPGDVIFCPRFVKHGYKVLGSSPCRFLEINWVSKDWQ